MSEDLEKLFFALKLEYSLSVLEKRSRENLAPGVFAERQGRTIAYGNGFSIYYNSEEDELRCVFGYTDEFTTFAVGTKDKAQILFYKIHHGRYNKQMEFLRQLRLEYVLSQGKTMMVQDPSTVKETGLSGALLEGEWAGGEQDSRVKSIKLESSWNLGEFVRAHAQRAADIMGASDVDLIPEPREVYD
jgi:hypothetical protein